MVFAWKRVSLFSMFSKRRAAFRNLELDEDDGTVIDRVIEEDVSWPELSMKVVSPSARALGEILIFVSCPSDSHASSIKWNLFWKRRLSIGLLLSK